MTPRTLLRFTTAGSVDDGKSTLIGRLLYDTGGAFDDQIDAVRKSKINRAGGALDLSLLTDGLRAEREQGITIDVAWRYFSTPRRKFILADNPGHEQYTRNMATGASTADVALILVDARAGFLPQSRRHLNIARLMGIRHLVVVVNKMDLAGWDESVFRRIEAEAGVLSIPVSALEGDNVVAHSRRTPWYAGPTLLDYLETVDPTDQQISNPFRMPVQLVLRPDADFRGFAGQIASGRVRPGDRVIALPSMRETRVARIVTFDGDLEEAHAPMSVNLVLEDEIDLSRGGVIASAATPPQVARRLEATLVWFHERPLEAGTSLLLRHGPHETPVRIETLFDAPRLAVNETGRVLMESAEPLAFDPYDVNRRMGAFILIDPQSNATLAPGRLERASQVRQSPKPRLQFRAGAVTASERAAHFGHRGALVRVDPLSPAAIELERTLFERGAHVIRLTEPASESLAHAGLLALSPAGELYGDSAQAILDRLAGLGIFFDHDNVSPGEGI
jgi:sulfate adenylyltransferase subunit 1